jgi:hypothetical protein
MFEIPQYMVDIAEIVSAGVVAGALFYAAREYRSKNVSEELNRSYYVLKDLHTLRASKIENPEAYTDSSAMDEWYERYFNTWEWFSYMVNKGQINDKELKRFFKNDALTTYERIFEPHYGKEKIDKDPQLYPEYRTFCKKLRCSSRIQRIKNRLSNPKRSVSK